MRIDFVPFQLGMQYENWEFTLDVLPDRLKGFDSYMNIEASLNNFLTHRTDHTEVIFNFDILEGVLLTFENRTQAFYNDLKESIFMDLGEQRVGKIGSFQCDDYSSKIAQCITYRNKNVYLLYCNKSIFKDIFYSIF